MKIIPLYLPQFQQIPENDEWWDKDLNWIKTNAVKFHNINDLLKLS
tara:strand:- start:116 stop:253 length:138 start_codon:yes stop_codon:yes gene_type:complete